MAGLVANNLIELMDYGKESTDHNYGHMIQAFHRFLMDNLSSEGNSYPRNPWLLPPPTEHNDPAPAPITQLCGIDAKSVITCMNCHAVREKENMTHVVDMSYPRKVRTPIINLIDLWFLRDSGQYQ
jgi:PAB-dependent poly(A)-specific ribonuclease subunit 2